MRKNFIISLTLAAAIVMTTGCGGNKKTSAVTDQDSVATVIVKTKTAFYEDIDNSAEFTSTIKGFRENNIAPSLMVRIEQILVDVGDNVRKGQILARMDPTQYNQQNITYTNSKMDYDRLLKVYEAGGISKSSLEQTETQLNVLRAQLDNLSENTVLVSPIDGVVTARNYDPGDLYNGSVPILEVKQINQLKVTVAISEQYFPNVKMGMPADIRVDMYPNRVFEGKVSLIHPAIDVATRTFNVEITIPNANRELRPGMFSRTSLHFGTMPALMVEDIAVQKQLGSNDKYLYVVKNGVAERRTVTTGRQVGSSVQIISGVHEGDEVIVAGISRLNNGTAIQVIND